MSFERVNVLYVGNVVSQEVIRDSFSLFVVTK